MADFTPESRAEEILYDTINGVEYTGLPESRIEELLLELKDVIETGSGTMNYNALENKPKFNNTDLRGNVTITNGLTYNASTNTISVSEQSMETYVEDALPNNMATDSEIDDLFND